MRIVDTNLVGTAFKTITRPTTQFDAYDWLTNDRNIALLSSNSDVTLFEYHRPSVYYGHYLYTSRGKDALVSASEALDEIFNRPYNAEIVQGVIPIGHVGARWLTRRLGFKSQGIVQTVLGPNELFIITRSEWFAILNKENK